jgi:hypothetical protein
MRNREVSGAARSEMGQSTGGEIGSHEEGLQRMLEGSDGTGIVGEGGLKMCDGLVGGPVGGRQRRLRATGRQSGADIALGEFEALPEALPGAVATAVVKGGADGGSDGAGEDAEEELPEGVGGETAAADGVGLPDAEGVSATGSAVAVAAKDTVSAVGFLAGLGLVVAVQMTVAIERADLLATWTRGEFEAVGNGVPFVFVAVKAW